MSNIPNHETGASSKSQRLTAAMLCLASVVAGSVTFWIWELRVVRRFEDACPWGQSGNGDPTLVGAGIAVAAGLLAFALMALGRTRLAWWAAIAAAALTAGVVGVINGIDWFLIGNCFG
jgi:hypothetical protein